MFLSSNAQTAPCCNHESVQSGSADRSVMGSGTNVQLLGVQKRIPVIDSSGLPDLACLCFFQAATFPAARLTDYRNTKPLFVKPRSQKQKISKPVALVLLVLRFFYTMYLLFFTLPSADGLQFSEKSNPSAKKTARHATATLIVPPASFTTAMTTDPRKEAPLAKIS